VYQRPQPGAVKSELLFTVTSATAKTPAATEIGDFILLSVMIESTSATIATPSGFTQIGSAVKTTGYQCSWFYKFATEGGELSISCTWGGVSIAAAAWGTAIFKRVNAVTPILASAAKAITEASKTIKWASLSPAAVPTLELCCAAIDNELSITGPTGFTQLESSLSLVAYLINESESPTGEREATSSLAEPWATMHILLLGVQEQRMTSTGVGA
jgi:hypothetical protein